MLTLARFSIRRPRAALLGWLTVVVVLSLIGFFGVSNSVSPSVTVVHGTDSYRAQHLAEQHFGPSQLVPILLEGPKAQLDRQGPKLVVALTKRADTRVLSAWDAGTASAGLRPKPTAAMIVASIDRPEKDVVKYDQPQIQRLVSRQITSPAKAFISGQPSIDKALKDETISTLKTASLIGIGVLFVLLLIGLRAPLAAALVTIVAGATTLATFGLMALVGKVLEVDALALGTAAIAGLARGSAFSLVMLDRFHRDEDADHARRAESLLSDAVGTTGRALLFAGTVMLAAMLLTDAFGVSDVLTTLGVGAVLATALATGAAVVVVPAALVLIGPVVNQWRLPAPRLLSRGWDRMVGFGEQITRHPLATGALAAVALLALAVPAFAVKSGPMDVKQLPPHNKARVAFNEISRVMGAGYPTPYDVIVVKTDGPLTSVSMLSKLSRFETQIARDKAVVSLVGPGAVYTNARQLKTFGPQLQHSASVSKKSKKDLVTLINGLGQAGAGSAQLQAGLAEASAGANQLHGGSGQAQTGAGQLHAGLAQAKSGSEQLSTGLNQALSGAQQLKAGAGQALTGSNQLVAGLGLAQGPASQSIPALNGLASATASTSSALTGTQGRAQSASAAVASALASLDKTDPHYGSVAAALQNARSIVDGLSSDLGKATSNAVGASGMAGAIASQAPGLVAAINLLRDGASQLQTGIQQLRNGNSQLASGIGQLAGGGGQLKTGLGQLTDGAGQLQAGLALLTNGTGQLASGLTGGVGPAGQLVTGLGLMQAAVIKSRGQIPSTKDLETLQKQSPGIFNSGYFVLAAVEGAQPADRNASTFALNLLRGGNAGQILVTGRYPVSDVRAKQLGERLRTMAAKFAKANHLNVAVGGPAGSLFDIARTANKKLPWAMLGVPLGVALLLSLMLRSILIPLIAVLSAALVTASGVGVMQLLFGGHNPPLGGPGTFDPISTTEILAAIFGATLIYLVVLMTRARDYYVATGDPRRGLVRAMGATAASTTGMAATTIGVVIPFMFTELQPIRRIAVAAALAVGLTAYVVVPVLLPAAMSLFGRFGWWPTHGSQRDEPTTRSDVRRRFPWLHLPHRLHRPAHQ